MIPTCCSCVENTKSIYVYHRKSNNGKYVFSESLCTLEKGRYLTNNEIKLFLENLIASYKRNLNISDEKKTETSVLAQRLYKSLTESENKF